MALGYLPIDHIENNSAGNLAVATVPKNYVTRALGFRYLVGATPTNWPDETMLEMRIGQKTISRIRLDRLEALQNGRTPAATAGDSNDDLWGKNLTFPLGHYDISIGANRSIFMFYFGQDVRSDATDFALWLGQADVKEDDSVQFLVQLPATSGGRMEVFHQSVEDPKNQFKVGQIITYQQGNVEINGEGPRDLTGKFDRRNYLQIYFEGLDDDDGLVVKSGGGYLINEREGLVKPGHIAAAFNGSWSNYSFTKTTMGNGRLVVMDPDERLSSRWPAMVGGTPIPPPIVTVNSADSGDRAITIVTQALAVIDPAA